MLCLRCFLTFMLRVFPVLLSPHLTVPFSSRCSICPVCLGLSLESLSNVMVCYARLRSQDKLLCRLQGKASWGTERTSLRSSGSSARGQVQVHLPEQQLKWLWSVSALLAIAGILRVVLRDGHEGFTSHFCYCWTESWFGFHGLCWSETWAVCDVITESVWSFLCRMLSLQCSTAQLFSCEVLSEVLDVLMKSAVLSKQSDNIYFFF